MNEENKMSRRQVVAGLGTTLAAVAVSPAFAASRTTKATDGPAKISDPTTLYPKPPLKASRSHGPVYKVKWTRCRIAVKQVIKVQAA